MSDHADAVRTWALIVVTYALLGVIGWAFFLGTAGSGRNRVREAQIQVGQYSNFVEEYYVYTGDWPPSLAALVNPPRGVAPFVGEVRSDPWREPHWYRLGGPRGYTLCSGGPDRRLDTDDDICS